MTERTGYTTSLPRMLDELADLRGSWENVTNADLAEVEQHLLRKARPDAATLREQIARVLHRSCDGASSDRPVGECGRCWIPTDAVIAVLAEHGIVKGSE